MSKSDSIKFIDFEISSICNAGCSVCPRRSFGHFTEFAHTYWSIEDTIQTIDKDIASNLVGLQFCGNFGDPMGNPDVSKITRYFRENNEDLSIYVKTNGGIGDSSLYEELAELGVIITFGIDGYGSKNELYRVNVKWEKLIQNLESFTKKCKPEQFEVQFIMWRETTDQILPIIELMEKVGFGTLFLRKPFTTGIKTEVFNMRGESTHFLTEIQDVRLWKYLDTKWEFKDLNSLKEEISNLNLIEPIVEYSDLKIYPKSEILPKTYEFSEIPEKKNENKKCQTCFSKNFKDPKNLFGECYNIFITHNKYIMPCCFIPPNISNEMFFSSGQKTDDQKEVLNRMVEIGFEKFNFKNKTLREVFDSGVLHSFVYNDLMNNTELKMCNIFCNKCD